MVYNYHTGSMMDITWYHSLLVNEQYHGGRKGIPDKSTLAIARTAALWVFSVLFDVSDPEDELEQAILDRTPLESIEAWDHDRG